MNLRRVGPPVGKVLSAAELKDHLRVDHDDEDATIIGLGDAAVSRLEGYSGILGRVLLAQTWQLVLPRFPAGPIKLPLPPLISVESIAFVDASGSAQSLALADVIVHAGPLSMVEPAPGKFWPATQSRLDAVTITFECGYGAAPDVPDAIKQAIKLMVWRWYEDRGSDDTPAAAKSLLAPFIAAWL